MAGHSITYFLGAGASADALPLYVRKDKTDVTYQPSAANFNDKNFAHRFITFLNEGLYHLRMKINTRIDKYSVPIFGSQERLEINTVNDIAISIKKNGENILKELKTHLSVDTIAKKLFTIGNEKDLKLLKATIAVFFVYEQIFKNRVDGRYDSFIATIVGEKPGEIQIDKRLKIVTWNYDIQFELAFATYLPKKELPEIQRTINSFPRIQIGDQHDEFRLDEFGIVRLNATAGLKIGKDSYLDFLVPKIDSEIFLKNYLKICSEENLLEKIFSFSWEKNHISNASLLHAKEIFNKTTVLVIIGYSFPIFNKKTDQELFNSIKESGRQFKIHIQDPRGEQLKKLVSQRFGIHESFIEFSDDLFQFYIPEEL